MSISSHQEEMLNTFWGFLGYLKKYVEVAKTFSTTETDPARTLLLSTLTENMCPVFRADLAFVGYRNVEQKLNNWIQIDPETIKPDTFLYKDCALLKQLDAQEWRIDKAELEIVQPEHPALLFGEGLQKLPLTFRGLVTALAMCRVGLFGREYFLFFCDIEEKMGDSPRYSDFDRTMLTVATGMVEVGFQSGVRRGRKVQQEVEEAQTTQFLLDLAHEIKTPIQGILADASNLLSELPPDLVDQREMAKRNVNAANHLSMLVDNIRLALSNQDLPKESLIHESVVWPLKEAVDILVGEAQVKNLKIIQPVTLNDQPWPKLLIYHNQLTLAFKNLIHNAIAYSLLESGQYRPIEIVGHQADEIFFAVDFINYGLEITPEEITEGKLFNLRYRSKKARQLVASGSGLGLSLVRRTVERHGGRVSVTSTPTNSALFKNVFRVLLPLYPIVPDKHKR